MQREGGSLSLVKYNNNAARVMCMWFESRHKVVVARKSGVKKFVDTKWGALNSVYYIYTRAVIMWVISRRYNIR